VLTKDEVIAYLLRHGKWCIHSTTPNAVEAFERELAEYGYAITQSARRRDPRINTSGSAEDKE
jgi:hypothetical protein